MCKQDFSKCPECGSKLVECDIWNNRKYECESTAYFVADSELDFLAQSRECKKRVIEQLRTENSLLKRQLRIEQRAHEMTIENCTTCEDEEGDERSLLSVESILRGSRYLAELEIGEG